MSDQESSFYLDVPQDKFDFTEMEQLFFEKGYYFEHPKTKKIKVGSFDMNTMKSNDIFYTKDEFLSFLKNQELLIQSNETKTFSVDYYKVKTLSAHSTRISEKDVYIKFIDSFTFFWFPMSGYDLDEEADLVSILRSMSRIYGERHQALGCLVDSSGGLAEWNWAKFFVEDTYVKRKIDLNIIDNYYRYYRKIEKTTFFSNGLPNMIGIPDDLLHNILSHGTFKIDSHIKHERFGNFNIFTDDTAPRYHRFQS